MNRVILVLFLFFSLTNAFSQEGENDEYRFWYFQQDSPVYVFVNKAYLRSDADVKSEIVDSLSVGTKLFFKEETKARGVINGLYAPWIKVSTANNREGYIWAGVLAFAKITSKDIDFICGVDRVEKKKIKGKEVKLKYTIRLKAVTNDSLINFAEWKIDADESARYTEIKLLGNVRLRNLLDVVRVSFGGEACGVPMNYYYYGWSGKEFFVLPTKYSVGDAGIFYHAETLFFPNEPGGQPNKIIKVIEEEEVLEEATETKKEKIKKSNSKEVYVWDGYKAILQKINKNGR